MNKQVFIINGPAESGKDTFVSMVRTLVPSLNYSSVELVKEAAAILGWNGEKTDKDRKFLSDLKDLTTRYSNKIESWMVKKVENFMDDGLHEFIFFHIREPLEIDRMKNLLNAKTILIKRSGVSPNTSNHADANVFHYDYDIIIMNNGSLGDLKSKAEEFAEKYGENYGREEITDS